MCSMSSLILQGDIIRPVFSPDSSAWCTGALMPTMRPPPRATTCSPRVGITHAGLQSTHSVQSQPRQQVRHACTRPYLRQSSDKKYVCEASRASLSLSQEGDAPSLEAWEQPPRSWEQYPIGSIVKGVTSLVVVERAIAMLLEVVGGPFPAPVLVLAGIAITMALNNSTSKQLYSFHAPAVSFFDAWLPMFFVPSVAAIALAPALGGGDLIKAAIILGGTYTFNLWLSGILCSAVSRLWKQGGESDTLSNEEKVRRVRAAAGAWGQAALTKGAGWMEEVGKRSADKELKKAAQEGARKLQQLASSIPVPLSLPPPPPFLSTAALTLGAILLLPLTLIPWTKNNAAAMTPGFLIFTVGLFTAAKKLPPRIRQFLNPTLSSGAVIVFLTALYGAVSLGSWKAGIQLYKSGTGAILGMLIGPAVASLGFKVHTQRDLLNKSIWQLTIVCLLAVPLGLTATAVIGRVLGAPSLVTLSLLPATTTLGLAREMGPKLGSNRGLLVAGVTIAGTAGISTARQLMEKWKVVGPTARGLAVGNSSHTLGASAFAMEEPQTAAVAGLALALKGTISVIAILIPSFRAFLMNIATG